MSALNEQIGGNHYKDMPIGPNEFCQINKEFIGPIATQIIGYACRIGRKDGDKGAVRDLKKIMHFAEMIMEIDYPAEHKAFIQERKASILKTLNR